MDLLEYQAKDLFRAVGIPVLPSQRVNHTKDIKSLTIPYPIVLKSQVYMGGRGRVGGVRFVENTIDAIAAAQAIFNLSIMGEYPSALLAEPKYDTEQEFYLAVVLNQTIRRPVLLGSAQGGMDVQASPEQIHQVVVDGEFSPFYARRLVLKMGLQGPLMNRVCDVLERMYSLAVEKDLDLVEINPLGISSQGEAMALDGKITVNDGALARHADLMALSNRSILNFADPHPTVQLSPEPDGQIAVICNGAGLTMAVMDLVHQAGGKPYCCLNLGSETHHQWEPSQFCERLLAGLHQVSQYSSVRVILLNLMLTSIPSDQIAALLRQFLQTKAPVRIGVRPRQQSATPLVVRWGAGLTLNHPQIHLVDDLDAAVDRTVRLASAQENRR
jgi:succinyl-CoA synthetase beta subunit